MLKKLYLAGLSSLLLAALGGLAYCLWLALQGDPRGLANMGKCLLIGLYSAYRLRSILNRSYQIYRAWESERARRVKRLLHAGMGASLGLLACAVPAAATGIAPAPQTFVVLLAILLASFLALETLNAVNRDPVGAYE